MRSIMAETQTTQSPMGRVTPARSISSAVPSRQVGFSPAPSPVGSYTPKTPLERGPIWRTTSTTPVQSGATPGSVTPVRPSAPTQSAFPSLSSATVPASSQAKPSPARPIASPIPGRSVSGQNGDGKSSQPAKSNVIVPTRLAAAVSRKNR